MSSGLPRVRIAVVLGGRHLIDCLLELLNQLELNVIVRGRSRVVGCNLFLSTFLFFNGLLEVLEKLLLSGWSESILSNGCANRGLRWLIYGSCMLVSLRAA